MFAKRIAVALALCVVLGVMLTAVVTRVEAAVEDKNDISSLRNEFAPSVVKKGSAFKFVWWQGVVAGGSTLAMIFVVKYV